MAPIVTTETQAKKPAVAEPLLPAGWGVPEEFRARLGDEAGRQRLMESGGHLLLVLHAPPRAGERFRQGRLFWRTPEGLWKPQSLRHSEHALGELLGEYEACVAELETSIDSAEEARDYFEVLTSLAPLVRAARNLCEVLHDARQAARDDRGLILLRDRGYALARHLELLNQEAKNTLDFVIARRSEEQAEASRHQARAAHRLNVMAALFFPIATLGAVFGMDLGHGLEAFDSANAPVPMLVVLGAGLVLGFLLTLFITRK